MDKRINFIVALVPSFARSHSALIMLFKCIIMKGLLCCDEMLLATLVDYCPTICKLLCQNSAVVNIILGIYLSFGRCFQWPQLFLLAIASVSY